MPSFKSATFWITLIVVIAVSFLAGRQALSLFETVSGLVFSGKWGNNDPVFIHSDYAFPAGKSADDAITISWQSLQPVFEADIANPLDLNAKSFSDSQYQSFIESIDTNSQYVGELVRLPGFIVPIALLDDQFIKGFFLVPYFGACVHFPPPPPNQMVYVEVGEDFPLPNVYNAYLVEGVLRADVFEDPRGTSAYFMDLYRVTLYDGEPDDVRNHTAR